MQIDSGKVNIDRTWWNVSSGSASTTSACGPGAPAGAGRPRQSDRRGLPGPQSINSSRVCGTSFRFTLVLCTKIVKSSLWSGLTRTSASGRPSRARASGPV